MKACCLTGSLHPGTPAGRIETLHGLPCYITEPTNASSSDPNASASPSTTQSSSSPPRALIVYLPDAFGWDMPNNRLLADIYARRSGATVYLPEFMAGNGFPAECLDVMMALLETSEGMGWGEWVWKKTGPFLSTLRYAVPRLYGLSDGNCRPRILNFLAALRENEGKGFKIGVAGFCWGGHHVVDLCSGLTGPDGAQLVDAGFTAHPSNVAVPVDFEKVQVPLSVSIGDIDFGMAVDKCREGKKVLDAKQEAEGNADSSGNEVKKYEFVILDGAKHGFATRHDKDDVLQERSAQSAEDQAVRFWARWIGTNGEN